MTKHNTGIEWTHIPGFKGETWNPIVGCSVVSPGCTNCYAMGMAKRLEKMKVPQYVGLTVSTKAGPVWSGRLNRAPDSVWAKPLRWKKPRAIFVNSMGDIFHEDVLEDWLFEIFATMALCPQHIFIILTKRAERMMQFLRDPHDGRLLGNYSKPNTHLHEIHQAGFKIQRARFPERSVGERGRALDVAWPLPNVWLGVSVEDQARANERIPYLMHTVAAKRFLSCEPLLGPVNLRSIDVNGDGETDALFAERWSSQIEAWRDTAEDWKDSFEDWFGRHPDEVNPDAPMYRPIDWVIAGGESGNDARPMHPDWIRGLRDQCAETDAPFFFKQWGEWIEHDHHKDGPTVRTYSEDDPEAEQLIASAHHPGFLHESGRFFETWDDVTTPSARLMDRVGKRAAGHVLDGATHQRWPEIDHDRQ